MNKSKPKTAPTDYAEKHGLKAARGQACPQRLLGRKGYSCSGCRVHSDGTLCFSDLPSDLLDHRKLYSRNGRPEVIVFEPYLNKMTEANLLRLQEQLAEHGFTCKIDTTVSTEPWRNRPGKTGLIEIWAAD